MQLSPENHGKRVYLSMGRNNCIFKVLWDSDKSHFRHAKYYELGILTLRCFCRLYSLHTLRAPGCPPFPSPPGATLPSSLFHRFPASAHPSFMSQALSHVSSSPLGWGSVCPPTFPYHTELLYASSPQTRVPFSPHHYFFSFCLRDKSLGVSPF